MRLGVFLVAVKTPVPKTTVKVIDGAGGGMEAVGRVAGVRNEVFAEVASMLQGDTFMKYDPQMSLHSYISMVALAAPPLQGFQGDGVGLETVATQVPFAGGGD